MRGVAQKKENEREMFYIMKRTDVKEGLFGSTVLRDAAKLSGNG